MLNSPVNVDNQVPLIIIIFKDTLLTSVFVVSSSIFFPLWKNGLKCNSRVTSICSRSKNLNLSWQTLSFGANPTEQCLQNGFRSSLQESKALKSVPKLHKYFTPKLSALFYVVSQITNGRECFQVNFVMRLGSISKKQLFHKSWPITLMPLLSQGNFAIKSDTCVSWNAE